MRGVAGWMIGAGLAVALAGPAAAMATAEDAAALERELRGWIAGLLAPLVAPDSVPLRVLPAGEGYRLEVAMVPLPALSVTPEVMLSGFARPLDGGRWEVEDMRLPAALSVGLARDGTRLFAMSIGQQQAGGSFDPSLRTPSRYSGRYADVVEEFHGPNGPVITRMATIEYGASWEPAGEGQVDSADRMVIGGYAMEQKLPGGQGLLLSARELTATSKGAGWAPGHLAAALRSVAALAGEAMAAPDGAMKGGPTAGQRKLIHAALEGVAGLFLRFETEQTWSGITFATDMGGGKLDRLSLGTRMAAPGGRAEVALRLELAGLTSALIPRGPLLQLVPRRISIAPRLGGVPKAEVLALLGRAIDTAGDPDQDIASAALDLLADNPVVIALDDLDVDISIARLRGAGELKVASADAVDGTLELRMSGLDALLRTLRQIPEAGAVAPVLLMLKGLGEASGGETLWRIEYADHKVTVNGTDFSDMMPRK